MSAPTIDACHVCYGAGLVGNGTRSAMAGKPRVCRRCEGSGRLFVVVNDAGEREYSPAPAPVAATPTIGPISLD